MTTNMTTKTPRELMAIAEQSAEYFQRVIDSLRAEIAALKAAQPAPAAPYQVTDEDVEVACKVLCLSRHPSVVLLVRRALEAYEARKAAA